MIDDWGLGICDPFIDPTKALAICHERIDFYEHHSHKDMLPFWHKMANLFVKEIKGAK